MFMKCAWFFINSFNVLDFSIRRQTIMAYNDFLKHTRIFKFSNL